MARVFAKRLIYLKGVALEEDGGAPMMDGRAGRAADRARGQHAIISCQKVVAREKMEIIHSRVLRLVLCFD